MKLNLNELPINLKYLGNSAFYKGGENIKITTLPVNLKSITSWAFAHCKNVNISTFGSETPGEGLESIFAGALYSSGHGVKEITLLSSILKLESDNVASPNTHYAAFEGYAPNLESFISTKAAGQIVDQNN